MAAGIADNPWVEARGVSLDEFLAIPMIEVRARLARCVETVEQAARANPEGNPTYSESAPLVEQGAYREATLERLERLAGEGAPDLRTAVAALDFDVDSFRREVEIDLVAPYGVARAAAAWGPVGARSR